MARPARDEALDEARRLVAGGLCDHAACVHLFGSCVRGEIHRASEVRFYGHQ